jgi:hypothetical protein
VLSEPSSNWYVYVDQRERHCLGGGGSETDRAPAWISRGSVVASASTYAYNICSNGAAGDWYWEVTCRGEIIARGLAGTEVLARADALTAALSHVDPRPENLPAYLEDPSPSLARVGKA